ncbi:MAG: hypothetical protein QOG00_2333 [Pyrinomonadaceae bacterium]|nr:hypothetical protein [Pyrinomonadaceae bacterium]
MTRAASERLHPSGRARAVVRAATGALLWAKWRPVLITLVSLLAFAHTAAAQTNIYQLRGLSDYGIYVYNIPANSHTQLYKPYPLPNPGVTNSATLAQRPSDGMLFYVTYVQNANNQQLYRYNPATPTVAPVAVGTGLGAGVPSSLRMAFSPTGTLYYLPDTRVLYTIDTTTGVATPGITVGTATNITSGGDMAFNAAGTLYIVTSSKTLYTVSLVNGTATQIGNAALNFTDSSAANQPDATLGLAFDSTGRLLTQTRNPNRIYSIPLPVAANATPQANFVRNGDGDIVSTGDMASANVPQPNLSITKTVSSPIVYRGGAISYTLTVTNSSAYDVTGAVVDTVPASVTGVTWTCAATSPSFCAAANGSGNSINTSVTLAAGASATYDIDGTISATAATGTLTNQATVSVPAWLTDSNLTNNTASVNTTVTLNANLGITKTDNLTNVTPGSPVTYTVVVSNAGTDTANGAIVTDTVPAQLTGVAWTCGSPVGGATCGAASGSGNNINTTANLPSGGSVTYTITGTLSNTATGTLTNTARVVTPATGVTDPDDPTRTGAGNNSATDNTTINLVPDVRIAKTHSGNFTVGVNGSYTLTASNAGNGATSGTITVTDNLPTGLTVAAVPTPANWDCSTTVVGSSTLTCTSIVSIPAATTSANTITLSVVVGAAAFAASPVTNVATISGGGEPAFNNGNNTASDPTTILGSPNLIIAKTHTGNFTRGTTNASYTITVTNSGTAATNGTTVTVTDTVPAGLTPTAPTPPAGTVNGWSCVIAGQVVTCTRTDALPAGQSYPVIPITVTVSQTAANSVTNSVAVSGGGEPASLNGDNTATDPTTVVSSADLSLTKTANISAPLINQLVTFTLTVTNAGPSNAAGITVRDQLPAGLTFVSATPAASYNSVSGVWTVGSINSGANATLQIVARVTAAGTITNTAQVTASGAPDPDSTPNNNAAAEDDQASATLGALAPPSVILCKTFPGQSCSPPPSLPPQVPGADITYVINFTNTGGSPARTLAIADDVPLNTDFKVGTAAAALGSTGLTVSITYLDTNGAAYTPVSGGGGAPAGYDRNVKNVRWTFTGDLSPTAPQNTGNVSFTVRIR